MNATVTEAAVDRARRFGGVERLYGAGALATLEKAHIAVVGVGGVGSWTAEALARSGVGALTLIDLDHVAESNLNRQLHALEGTLGQAKVEAMQQRILQINPECHVSVVDEFLEPDNCVSLLDWGFSAVADCIDGVRAKVAMAAFCKRQRIPLVMAGAAGGKLDPTRIRVADLTLTEQDPLLSKVRSRLRKEHAFPRGPKNRFGLMAVYSDEPVAYPESGSSCDTGATTAPQGLNCAGFGSSVCVTASFGLVVAAQVLRQVLRQPAD